MEPGSKISHYEIAEKLGQGGMGVVYKAWDQKLKRPVALKFLPASVEGSEAQAARFHQEALAVSALNHPNIATIYDIEDADGHPFLALEFLPGGTLQTALEQIKVAGQQISLEQGLDYAIQLAEALAHAHSHGVIHRDIKTANVMFAESGALKLTDFGLAKMAEGAAVTQTGTVMGTPATMAPEQARGQEADERSDIFSAGVVLFALFTGEMPFKGANAAAVLYQVVHEPAPLLTRFRPGAPIALEQIVSKTLQKDPAERHQTAAGLASELRALRRDLLTGSSLSSAALETVVMTAGRASSEGHGSSLTQRESRSGLEGVAGELTGKIGGSSPAFPAAALPAARWRRFCSRRAVQATAACLAIATIVLVAWLAWPAQETRLAILPFTNVGGDAADQVFADGFREVLIGKLTGLERPRGLLVMVVSKKQAESGEVSAPADAASRLGANLVMMGSLIRTGPKPQFIVRLEDPQTLEERGAENIDVSSTDVSGATTSVVHLLKLGLGARMRLALEARRSSNPEAMRFYVEARGHLQRDGELDAAEQAFRDAISKDPKYAPAWSGLAEALWRKYHFLRDPSLLEEARQQAERALTLDSRLAEGHVVLARILLDQGSQAAAERELRAALNLEPANANAYQALGDLYLAQKDYTRAENDYRQAIEMRPGDAGGHDLLGAYYYQRNQPELLPQAEREFLNALKLAPYNYKAHSNLGVVYIKMERYHDAIEHFKTSLLIAPSVAGHSNLGTAYYYAGFYEDAAEEYRKATEGAGANYRYWGNLADAWRWAGKEDAASANYRKAIDLLKAERQMSPALQHATLAMYYVSIRRHGVLAMEDREQARREIDAAAKLEAKNADSPRSEIEFRKVLVYAQTGDLNQAFQALSQLRDTAPATLREVENAPALKEFRRDQRFQRIAGSEGAHKAGGSN